MTTTSTGATSTSSVVNFISRQHQLIKQRFTTVLDARSGDARARAFFDLRRLLAVHEAAEEEIVHPAARRNLAGGDANVKQRLNDEFTAKTALADLESMDINSPEFISRLRLLQHNVNEHAAWEETEELPQLQVKLSGEQLQRLRRAMEIAEAIAPTRPHPPIGSTAASAFVGPFAAMVDHARDAINAPGANAAGD